MTKHEALCLLEAWMSRDEIVTLPLVDIVICTTGSVEWANLQDWTFKGLIKIAYDLKDK